MKKAIDSGSPPCSPHTPAIRSGLAARPRSQAGLHQLADATVVDGLERVAGQQPLLEVAGHQASLDVVAAEPEDHLGQVVGAEREEVGHLGDVVAPHRGPGRLDHGADLHVEVLAHAGQRLVDLLARPIVRTRASSARVTMSGIMISMWG